MNKLNFGCGRKIKAGWINADIQQGKEVDYSFNFDEFPYPLKDNNFDVVLADNVFEHLENPARVLDEIHRICKKNAIIKIIVPYYHCRGAYNDITHKHYFNEASFDNLVNPEKHYRLSEKNKFKIKKMDLIPTRLGKLIYPKKLRWMVSLVLGEIISLINVELIVLK